MDDKEVGKLWDENAENWTKLARLGYDRCRNLINTPAFFKMLPNVSGLTGLDIGCGEGYNTRIAAKKGAKMTAIDISETFIKYAKETEEREPLGVIYQLANAVDLPFPDNHFHFTMATMSLMDMANHEKALVEAFRVLKPNGFFQFSISHPLVRSQIPWEWITDENDQVQASNGTLNSRKLGFVLRDYFRRVEGEIGEWIFGAAPLEMTEKMKKFKIPIFNHTLSEWFNLLIKTGFKLEEFCEPYASDEVLEEYPEEYDSRIIPYFLIVRCRK
ncbi:MAG: class I SAM-dependent methyltransferase [Promethearchaeota archaeon]|jgi:ubiquinone/menaquinone biosynthesis C-methylase UbiE